MNVIHARQSAPDSAWSMMPPAYAGNGGQLYSYEQQQPLIQQQQQQQHGHAFAPPPAPLVSSRHFHNIPAFYPVYAAPYQSSAHSSPATGNGYYPQHSRHAFAAFPAQRANYDYPMPPPPYLPVDQQPYAYSPFGYVPHLQEYYGGPEAAMAAADAQSRGRWQATVGGEANAGIWQQESAQGATLGGNVDHPSFDRPPHRSSSHSSNKAPQVQSAAPVVVNKPDQRPIAAENVEYDLISNTSAVPPPPSIELSAVPLADLATEMVWEACVLGAELLGSRTPSKLAQWSRMTTKPASLFSEVSEANLLLRSGSEDPAPRHQRFFPRTPELYGAIGEGRTRKVSSECGSDLSSPSSSAPGTPDGVDAIEAASAKKQRLAGLGFGFGYIGDSKCVVGEEDFRAGLDSPVDAIRVHARRLSSIHAATRLSSSPGAAPSLPAEPTVAFRQFVKQILTATLLAPEDLVLALYYVARIPAIAMIAPPPADQAHSLSAKASAFKAAPFKILLGALMIANKTLQDNSYRNETFASVSGIPLKDVNELEVYLFGVLKFDVAVRDDVWRTWVGVVRHRISGTSAGDLGDRYEVDLALQRLLRAPHAVPAAAPAPAATYERPSTPVNSPSALLAFDLDASGPLESPIRLSDRRREAYEASPCPMKYPTSNSRSFGVELSYNRF